MNPPGLPRNCNQFRAVPGLLCLLLLIVMSATTARAQPTCPNPPPVTISPQAPSDVCVPGHFSGNPIAFFDDFSWRSFIAAVWTAEQGQRGVPDSGKPFGPIAGPLVFETYKSDWEVFQPSPDGKSPPPAPSAWNSYAGKNPCGVNVNFGDVVLASESKFANLGQAGFGNLVGPLPSRNGIFTRYIIGYNETEFNQILSQGLYLRSNLPAAGMMFQNGALDVKAAWMDMRGVANPGRYYTRQAWVLDPFAQPPSCSLTMVGLVGLHIVVKTPSRPQWIWSTFEQIDNVPGGASTGPFNYNNGNGGAQPASNPNPYPPTNPPTVFNVQRLTPINPSTIATNGQYQAALAKLGGPWQFYQLVMTQWPVPGSTPANQGTPGFSFPGNSPPSAFANVTLETFDQRNIRTGCMNCHNLNAAQNPIAKNATDFLWSLFINAWPSTLPSTPASPLVATAPSSARAMAAARASPELSALKRLMQSASPH